MALSLPPAALSMATATSGLSGDMKQVYFGGEVDFHANMSQASLLYFGNEVDLHASEYQAMKDDSISTNMATPRSHAENTSPSSLTGSLADPFSVTDGSELSGPEDEEEKERVGHDDAAAKEGNEAWHRGAPAWARIRTPSPERRYMFYHPQHQQLTTPPFWSSPITPSYPEMQLMATVAPAVEAPPPPPQPVNLEVLIAPPRKNRSGRRMQTGGAPSASKGTGLAPRSRPEDVQTPKESQKNASVPATADLKDVAIASVMSVGSVGHPYRCNTPCKYARGGRVCKVGAACDHCHVCQWKRSLGRLAKRERESASSASPAEPEA